MGLKGERHFRTRCFSVPINSSHIRQILKKMRWLSGKESTCQCRFNPWLRKTPWRSESESEVVQSCPTLCNPVDCSLPGSSVHGILQTRILEWVAISLKQQFTPTFLPGKNTGQRSLVGHSSWLQKSQT